VFYPFIKEEIITDTTCADLIVFYLERLGIDTVFGVPGGAIEPFLNSLARSERRGGPRLVVARHESGAAFMADGYYRETGKMGVVCSTTGPGTTNLLTAVASAQIEQIPMLIITAQTPLPKFGKHALQESSCTAIDTVGLFRFVTNFNTLISHQEQLENKLVSAIMTTHRMPHGPAHISIPSDIFRCTSIQPRIHSDLLVHNFLLIDESAINRLIEKLKKVDNFVLYIGSGAGKAHKQIQEFIDITGAEFVASPTGKGWVNEQHQLYRGVYGFAGHESAKALIQNEQINLILAIGTNLNEIETSGWHKDLINTKLVHIDSCIEHFTRSPMANLHVLGRLDSTFDCLIPKVKALKNSGKKWHTLIKDLQINVNGGYATLNEPEKSYLDDSLVKPQQLMCFLAQKLPQSTRIFIDAGNSWAWATHYLTRSDNEGFYRIAMGYGSMTWAIGASVGSSTANPFAPTICIVGDGSYLMSAQEITVASQHKLPIIFLILNDSVMGMVMHGQRLGHQESIGWELTKINFAAMAEAMGIDSIVINKANELRQLNFNQLFAKSAPTLLDVHIDREEIPPMSDRIKGLSIEESATPGG
jgi:acetolactate synthase I/II/III large subunit